MIADIAHWMIIVCVTCSFLVALCKRIKEEIK